MAPACTSAGVDVKMPHSMQSKAMLRSGSSLHCGSHSQSQDFRGAGGGGESLSPASVCKWRAVFSKHCLSAVEEM